MSVPAGNQQPLALILARYLVSIVSVAAAVIDVDGRIVFCSEVGHVVLFHHDPDHDDARLHDVEAEALARWDGDAPLELAREGRELRPR